MGGRAALRQSNLNAWRDGKRVLKTLLRERFTFDPGHGPMLVEGAAPAPTMPTVAIADAAEAA